VRLRGVGNDFIEIYFAVVGSKDTRLHERITEADRRTGPAKAIQHSYLHEIAKVTSFVTINNYP
jgi:hypothetical protein